MADETMPVAEAQDGGETASYECAFHILPTVTDEEVPVVFAQLKGLVEGAGGISTNEEAPQLLDLAYEIEKNIDGARRRFNAAYFGWARFTAVPEVAAAIDEAFRTAPEVLRHLLVKLTREDEEQPFFVFTTRTEASPGDDGGATGEAGAEGEGKKGED